MKRNSLPTDLRSRQHDRLPYPTGIGFYSVYCVMENVFLLERRSCCRTTAVSNQANGAGACHYEGRCAVRGFTVNQPFAVDFFTKYSALGLEDVADHAWVDDTVLYGWISSHRGVVSCFTPSQAHFSSRQARPRRPASRQRRGVHRFDHVGRFPRASFLRAFPLFFGFPIDGARCFLRVPVATGTTGNSTFKQHSTLSTSSSG